VGTDAEAVPHLIVGSGRNGTTWTDYRIRPHRLVPRLSMVSSLGRSSGFITQSREAAERYIRFRMMLEYSPVLVKIIRGNLMLGWLCKHCAARIVFVARPRELETWKQQCRYFSDQFELTKSGKSCLVINQLH